MNPSSPLDQRFEESRPRLRALAYRMLGSASEAEDAVQEAWLRASRAEPDSVENPAAWLTTLVARVCLDALRSRRSRREAPLGDRIASGDDPEGEAVMADTVGRALLMVLNALPPAERVAFVLHDTFGLPFEEIAPIVGRSLDATRQLASRARRRVRGASEPTSDHERQRTLIEAFRAASRSGDLAALLAVLDPQIVLRADPAAVALGASAETHGADAVARTFLGRARNAKAILVEGLPGLAWVVQGRPKVAFRFRFGNDRIVGIDLLADPLSHKGVEILEA